MVSAHGRLYTVHADSGETIHCSRRGKRHDVACGDRVRLTQGGQGTGSIDAILPRRTLLYRSDPHKRKLFAANVTQAAIIVAGKPLFDPALVEACLVACEAAHVAPLIVLNKTDLVHESAIARARLAAFTGAHNTIIELCAKRDIAPLRAHIAGHTTVLVGQSGMGKSTLINALVGEVVAREGDVSEALQAGGHTTTFTRLYALDAHTRVIDSPGMQAFGTFHLSVDDIAHAHPEFREHLGHCRFQDCRHLGEPDCALDRAVTNGELNAERLALYRALAREVIEWQARFPEWTRE